MNDSLVKLAWALPLVLVIGVAAMLLLRRFLPTLRSTPPSRAQLELRESVRLSEQTQAHLVVAQGRSVLIVEAPNGSVAVQLLSEPAPLTPGRWSQAWPRRMS